MRRIYSALRPPIDQRSYADWITNCSQKLSLSTRGLIAFTSSFCLNQRKPNSAAYHVYIVDINTPYQPFLIEESESEYSIIEWDPSGTKLLVCNARGCATIYTSKDYLVSDWKPYFTQEFAAERFITASWYHLGLVSTINISNQNLKSPSNHLEYSDKIQQSKFGASLRLFGGKSAEGCILISRTGLVCCLTLMADGSVDVSVESITPLRSRIEVADICHNKDGSFIVGTSAGCINSTISFFQIYLTLKNLTLDDVDLMTRCEGRKVSIDSKQSHSFHLNIMSQILSERENASTFERVSHIKFVTKDCPDEVLIEVSGQNLSLIELWELESKKKSPVHSAILNPSLSSSADVKPGKTEENGNQQADAESTSKDWSFKGNYITDKELVTIQSPKFRLFGQNRQLNMILLVHKESSVCCMRKEDLQPIQENFDLTVYPAPSQTNGRGLGIDKSPYKLYQNRTSSGNNLTNMSSKSGLKTTNDKRQKQSVHITDLQFSSNQTLFVAIDSISQLHVVQIPPLINCQDVKDENTYLQYLLEYCLVTGNDWWDVMVCAGQESIDNICDKSHDAYERQPKHVQRKYFNRQLAIRASLYRCVNSAQSLCKSSDCYTMIMLNSIASTLKAALRSQDQDSPSENLTNFLRTQGTQQIFFNAANVIGKIQESEFYVETNLSQCLQPLSQWVADLATYLVVSLPQRVKYRTQLPGAGLADDREALETLRELLIIIKIWGVQNESSLPSVYRLNDQVDVLGSLFRILSICYATLGNGPDEMLLEECNQLTNNISIPKFSFFLEPMGVASPLLNDQKSVKDGANCLYLDYFKEPTMPALASLGQIEGAINMNGDRRIDVVRNISLGAHPVANIRHCTRCKSVSLNKPTSNTTRAWEQRWISSCVCGGSWVQSDKSFVNKVGFLVSYHQHQTLAALGHAHQAVR